MERRDIARLLVASTSVAGAAALLRPGAAQAQSCTGSAAPNYPITSAETAAGVVPSCTGYPPGSLLRYGADPTGGTPSEGAFNRALECNGRVFDDYPGGGRYVIANTIQFQRTGQMLQGQGYGESTSSSGTSIKYVGASGGKMVSFSNSSRNFSDCVLDNVFLDGNGLANIGVEVYNDGLTDTGSWRNELRNCAIWNVTAGANATAVFLGLAHAATSFANDSIFDSIFIENTARGFAGNGAVYRMFGCSVQACSDAAIHAGSGSFWTVANCVFGENNRDFDGTNIQMFDAQGCWFEGSTNGLYRAATAHTANFEACLLHTSNSACLMDFQDSAGNVSIRNCVFGQNNHSTVIANPNSTASYDFSLSGIPGGYGNGTVRAASATLSPGQKLILLLGRGTFFVGVNIWWQLSANVRSQATYSAFLFDGDNESVSLIANHTGSGGGQSYTLVPSVNSVTLTYTGSQTVSLYMSGTGVPG